MEVGEEAPSPLAQLHPVEYLALIGPLLPVMKFERSRVAQPSRRARSPCAHQVWVLGVRRVSVIWHVGHAHEVHGARAKIDGVLGGQAPQACTAGQACAHGSWARACAASAPVT